MQQVSKMLTALGIDNNFNTENSYYKKRDCIYTTHRIYINGRRRVKTFLDIIGFRNPNKTIKYYEIIK